MTSTISNGGFVMKRLLSVSAITLGLAFCVGNAAGQQERQPIFMTPTLSKCFDLLRLESLQYDPQANNFRINMSDPNQVGLLNDHFEVAGWLRGFFTGVNLFDRTIDGDVAKQTKEKEWMPWIYSYCRAHPTDNLLDAAIHLGKALAGSSNKDSK